MKRLAFLVWLISIPSFAGNFDCSVIYDEFSSLMNKHFIINPGNYVDVKNQKISRSDYNNQQKGIFTLKSHRKGYGIAMFRTNKNSYGKFMYTWGAPWTNGHPSLILKYIVRYGRVLDGYRPKRKYKIVIPSSYTVDLDTFTIAAGSKSDVWFHNVDGTTMYIQARNGANLYFAMESMCR